MDGRTVAVELRFTSGQYGQPRRVGAELDASLTMRDLKLLLCDTMGIAYFEQLLYAGNSLLPDDQVLGELGVPSGPIVITIMQDAVLSARPPPRLDAIGPTLHAVRPTQGWVHGGQRVELIVERLPEQAVCRFGTQLLPVQRRGEVAFVVSPPHAPGPASVEVSADGVHFTHSGVRFLYLEPGAAGDEALAVRAPARSCYTNDVRRVGLEASRVANWRPDDPGGCV